MGRCPFRLGLFNQRKYLGYGGIVRPLGHPHFERTHLFCDKWDQMSFDPVHDTMPLSAFEPMVRRLFTKKPFVYGD